MNIVVFSSVSWNFLWQRPQHIASRLAERGHKIIYFNEPIYVDSAHSLKRLIKQKRLVQVSEVQPNVYVVTFYLPPFRGRLASIKDRFLKNHLNYALSKLKLTPDIALFYCLRFFPLLKTLNAKNVKVAFDYVDDLTAFPEFADSRFGRLQFDLVRASSVVFASSKILCDRVRTANPNCVYLPNAMDYSHFNIAAAQKMPLDELSALRSPIIGYIGAFHDWVDAELVCKLAQAHPEYSILIVGPVNYGKKEMDRYSNILMVGTKPYQQLPSYLSNIDVCLIPFKINPITLASNPIKMYEYLAAGKPVVSTALPEIVRNASEVVYIGRDTQDFIAKVEAAVKENLSEASLAAEKRMGYARANSWASRVDVIEAELKGIVEKPL